MLNNRVTVALVVTLDILDHFLPALINHNLNQIQLLYPIKPVDNTELNQTLILLTGLIHHLQHLQIKLHLLRHLHLKPFPRLNHLFLNPFPVRKKHAINTFHNPSLFTSFPFPVFFIHHKSPKQIKLLFQLQIAFTNTVNIIAFETNKLITCYELSAQYFLGLQLNHFQHQLVLLVLVVAVVNKQVVNLKAELDVFLKLFFVLK